MSPNEWQLRAALRAGEGQPVDADTVINRARQVRHGRRVRIASVAAAVIAVAGIGTGATMLGGGSPEHASSGADRAASSRGQPTQPIPLATCPALPIHLMVPGGGGTGQFGGSGPLFAQPVKQLLVCGYAASSLGTTVGLGGSLTVTGTDAGKLADSLNAAPTKRTGAKCPAIVLPVRQLVLYATSTSGDRLPPVVVHLDSCPELATNGTAVRYDWAPPAAWAAQLQALTKAHLPAVTVTPPGHPSGSPLH